MILLSVSLTDNFKEGDMIRRIFNILTGLLVTIVFVFIVALGWIKFSGMQVFTIVSGSMEPVYQVGSIVVVKDKDPCLIQEGDVISFKLGESTVVTHRVLEVLPDPDDCNNVVFKTKGDANSLVDGGYVKAESVIGVPVMEIPYLGFVILYMQNPPGKYIVLLAIASIVILNSMCSNKKGG